MTKPPLQFDKTLHPGGIWEIGVYENGAFVVAYTSFHGFHLAEALSVYRRAIQLYGRRFSLPFKEALAAS